MRKCRILASRLKHEELKIWVQRELDGYKGVDIELVPAYRKTKGQCLGHFAGPFRASMRNAPIPESNIPEDLREFLVDCDIRDGVAGLVQLLNSSNEGNLAFQWPGDAAKLFGDKIYENFVLIQGWTAIPKSFVTNILSTVRNRVLNFALEIEAQNPDAGEAPVGSLPIPKENVSQIFNNYIYGDVANVASGSGISQTANMTVIKGNFDSLKTTLKSQGVDEAEILELKKAIKEDPIPKSKTLGPKVASWVGKMVGKAASGIWQIGVDTAANLLSTSIQAYYGVK